MNRYRLLSLKTFLLVLVLVGNIGAALAQSRIFHSISKVDLHGVYPHNGGEFHRVDTGLYNTMPQGVKQLYTHTPGIYVHFKTDSRSIAVKWVTSPAKSYNNLAAIAFEGLDLYIKRDGKWVYAGVGRPSTKDTTESTLVTEMAVGEKECLLYLPLYDTVNELSIGVDSAANFSIHPSPFEVKVPIYGTSIVHGASASRPGLAYPARMSRLLGVDFFNFGISGSAKMEPSVAHMLANREMDALIVDCIPNCSPDQVRERTADFIRVIRAKHPNIPILTLEGAFFESGNFNEKIAADMNLRNERFREEISKLQTNDPHLYLLSAEGLMGDDHEGTIDGTHPNDLGFDRMLQKILPFTKNILQKYNLL